MAKIKVMVTGASGFLGGKLVQALLGVPYREQYEIFVLGRSQSRFEPFLEKALRQGGQGGQGGQHQQGNLQLREGDITHFESLYRAFQGMDLVFHLAAFISYKQKDNELMHKVNVQGTENVLQACIQLGIPELVYVSSVSAIGASRDGKHPLNEKSSFELESLGMGYFNSKHEAEKKVLEAHRHQKIKAYIVNPSTVYGPGDARKGSRRFQLKVARGQFPFYPPGGVNVVHIEDVVQGLLCIRQKGRPGERYILAGENLLIRDLFRLIARRAGVKAPSLPLFPWTLKTLMGLSKGLNCLGIPFLDRTSFYPPLLFHWFCAEKASKELGISFQEAEVAIHASVDWIKEQGLLTEK